MELLKPIKPYLERRYAVVSDRADLYAYFFELGLRVLRPGGRLGYISSSTFFRTGSGAPLRRHLGAAAALEAVVDFGDLQVFEGVTTYPAILTMRKLGGADLISPSPSGVSGEPRPARFRSGRGPDRPDTRFGVGNVRTTADPGQAPPPSPPLKGRGEDAVSPLKARAEQLRFLNLKTVPADLSAAFAERAEAMPRARLTSGSWRFEGDRLDAIRAKMAAGRETITKLYGRPLAGIKTGLNAAFVLSRLQRDNLVRQDHRLADHLKRFAMGDDIYGWYLESRDRHLIYTPRGRLRIEEYPALERHLSGFKLDLERRAGPQQWYELQQAQLAYEPFFNNETVVWRDISSESSFTWLSPPSYIDMTCFVLPKAPKHLLAFLGSRVFWFQLAGMTPIASGGYNRLKAQYFDQLYPCATGEMQHLVDEMLTTNQWRADSIRATLHRLADLHPAIETTPAFRAWPDLSFKDLRALLAKRFRGLDMALAERDDWERWYDARRADVAAARARVAAAEAEINDRVYRLFDLTPDEVAAVEGALAGQY